MPTGGQRALRVTGFSGVDEHYAQPPASFSYLQDARWDDRGGWEMCGGTQKILKDSQGVSPVAGEGAVTRLCWYCQPTGLPTDLSAKLLYYSIWFFQHRRKSYHSIRV